jgi:hypothetical protein
VSFYILSLPIFPSLRTKQTPDWLQAQCRMLSVFLSQPLTLLAQSVESATSAAKFQPKTQFFLLN